MDTRIVTLPFIPPMDHQIPFWKAADLGINRFVLSYPRRGGKDITSCSFLAREAMTKQGTYWILAPTKTQATSIYWSNKSEINYKCPITGEDKSIYGSIVDVCIPQDIRASTNETDKRITLINGSIIRLGGTADESFVGGTGAGFVITEFSLDGHSDDMLELLNPILSQSGGWLLINGTHRTDENRLNSIIEQTQRNRNWFTDWRQMGDLSNTCWVSHPDEEGKREFNINPHLLGRSHPLTNQLIANIQDLVDVSPHKKAFYIREYINVPTDLEEGSYYEHELMQCTENENIADIHVHDMSAPVYTAWDIGIADKTSIVFFQLDDEKNPIVIDYYENNGHGVKHYIEYINKRSHKYYYGRHFVPVDGGKRSFQLGTDLITFCKNTMGFELTRLHKTISIKADIETVRDYIPNTKFNLTKTDTLRKALYGYREGPNGKPLHNDVSHGADAFRYMCIAINANLCVPLLHKKYKDDIPTRVMDRYETDQWDHNYNDLSLQVYVD